MSSGAEWIWSSHRVGRAVTSRCCSGSREHGHRFYAHVVLFRTLGLVQSRSKARRVLSVRVFGTRSNRCIKWLIHHETMSSRHKYKNRQRGGMWLGRSSIGTVSTLCLWPIVLVSSFSTFRETCSQRRESCVDFLGDTPRGQP